ncbi:MAG: chitobiase/beta-hexosaminidase C-terminal domain-containing protein [Spirochaetaceae bacterium]|jgi:hypothetical protein|nr:chitobiase/beta-hexosaminidase C-terminal domain-containing protein [Spirochaetaceae bacterium]
MRKSLIFTKRTRGMLSAVLLALLTVCTSCDQLEPLEKPGAGSGADTLEGLLPRLKSLDLGDDYPFVDNNGNKRNFREDVFKYKVELPPLPSEITINAAVSDKSFKIDYVTGKTFTPEHGTIAVISVSNTSGVSAAYFITFQYDDLPIAQLAAITLSRGAVDDFNEETTEYDVSLPAGDGSIGVFPIAKSTGSVFSYEPASVITLEDDGTGVKRGTIVINIACTNHEVGVYTLNFSEEAVSPVVIALPTADPPGGYFLEPQTVTLFVDNPEAFIFYSLDATNPADAQNRRAYTEPVIVPLNTTLKAVTVLFVEDVPTVSGILQETYTLMGTASQPQADVVGGVYNEPQTVVLSSMTPDAAIYYTTDGSTPTEESSLSTGPIPIGQNTVLKAYTVKHDMVDSEVMTEEYFLAVAAPAVSPGAGIYREPQNVGITCETAGAVVYYTLNDAVHSPAESPARQGPFALPYTIPAVATGSTLRVYAAKANWTDSAVVTAAYEQMGTTATPQASPSAATFYPTEITLACATEGAEIYYTTDGSTPTTGSTLYTVPILVSVNTVLKAIAVQSGLINSEVMAVLYEVATAAPVASIPAGTYDEAQSVALSSTTEGASIYYTTNGQLPSTGSLRYTGPIDIAASMTIKAMAIKVGMSPSGIVQFAYTINP